jgi:hypothetical protein
VSSFAIFIRSYVQEFHGGPAAILLVLTIHSFMASFLAAWIERLTNRFWRAESDSAGLGILGLVLLSAQAIGSKVWQLYIFYAMLGAVSNATTSVRFGVMVSVVIVAGDLALSLTQAGF